MQILAVDDDHGAENRTVTVLEHSLLAACALSGQHRGQTQLLCVEDSGPAPAAVAE